MKNYVIQYLADSRRILALTLGLLAAGPEAVAQDAAGNDAGEELQTIDVSRPPASGDDEPPEEEFNDMVFDEETGSYRLIESDEGDDWVEPPTQREQDEEELRRLFALYKESLDNKQYLEADTLAKQVVELSIKLNGLDSHDSAKAITNLAIAQHNNEEYEAALLNFAASIDIIERIDDRLSANLINPLQGLAATHAAMGRPDLAQETFQRAVHVSHVNEGPHNQAQVETLESMAELLLSIGEYEDAIDIQEHIYAIESRKIDPDSIDMIPALENRARWQHRLQIYHRERVTWRRVINILEREYGKEDLRLIPPLKSLGRSYLFVSPAEYEFQPDVSSASGETYLRRANRIADTNPDADWKILQDTLLTLGDYYVVSGRPNRASRVYNESWDKLSNPDDEDLEERLKYRQKNLETPVVLQQIYPPKYYNSERTNDGRPPPPSYSIGTISFGYTVNPNGRVANLKHIETQPAEIDDFYRVIAREIRRLIYRPRLVDGKMSATPNMVYTHDFFYREADLNSDPDNGDGGDSMPNTGGE